MILIFILTFNIPTEQTFCLLKSYNLFDPNQQIYWAKIIFYID